MAQKTLYTHHIHGFSLRSLRILHPTRLLDSLHTNPHLHHMNTSSHLHFPLRPILQCPSPPRPHQTSSTIPLPISWGAKWALRGAVQITAVAGLVAHVTKGPPGDPDSAYTDGSKIGSPPASGASAVLLDGRIAVCRVPGHPNSYKAEVIRILLGSTLSPPSCKLQSDFKGAMASTTGTKRLIRHAQWVVQARQSLLRENQTLDWIEGHTGHVFQERSDQYANPPPPFSPPPPGTSSGTGSSCNPPP